MKNKTATVATFAIVSSAFGATTAFADSDTYTVKKGDTLTKIAQKFNTTVSNLMQWNGLKSDKIFANQTLTISGTSQSATAVKITAANTSSYSYTVVPGDTLLKIANKHGISLAELVTLNQLKDHIIYPGQILKITGSSAPVAVKSPPSVSTANTSVYKIQSGDTLSKIAKKFNMTVGDLKVLNNLTTDLIYAGTSLRVSGGAAAAPSESKSVESTVPPTTDNAKTDTYVIKSGDTLDNIASKFNMSVATLKSLNDLTSDLIFTGQKLKITGTASSPSNREGIQTSKPIEPESTASASTLINEAKKLIGIPYKWAGTTTAGFDCSGFIFYVYNKAGYDVSRTSAQGYYDRSYEVDQPQIGDLVFFENTYKKGISHLGIYVGNNQFIHASSSGVTITSLDTSYWSQRFEGFKRFY